MNRFVPLAAILCLTGGVVACSDRDDDVVQAPAPGAATSLRVRWWWPRQAR